MTKQHALAAKPVQAPMCPYCHGQAKFYPRSEAFYNGRDFGPLWACVKPDCMAWVGVHRGTMVALGTLANKELRILRTQVHAMFDPIWLRRWEIRSATDPKYRKFMARNGRYKHLAELMHMDRERCHIAMFDENECRLAIKVIQSGALEQS